MEIVKVSLKTSPYNIYIGSGIMPMLGGILHKTAKGRKVLLFSNSKIYGLHGKKAEASLKKYFDYDYFLIPDGERFKNIRTIEAMYSACTRAKIDRYSSIIAFGGGVVGDLAGFVAATYMRGVALVNLPTTLLADVDSGIGGKTGFDLESGKNLVGAFYQPDFVLTDIDLLKTLPASEYKNGMAEVIKYGMIRDEGFFEYIERHDKGIKIMKRSDVLFMVKKCSEIKAEIVAKDERETMGLRAVLNYGHTAGHAIESALNYRRVKHGEAAAIGMAVAAGIAKEKGLCDEATLERQNKLLKSFGLLQQIRNLKPESVMERLFFDKKAVNGMLRFVLPRQIGRVNFVGDIKPDLIKKEICKYISV